MSKNINQIFGTNPITSNASTDLMYFGQSPYGAANDAAMTYSNFSAQFTLKVQTTKGDLIGFSTLPVRVGVGSNGQLLQSDSTAGAGISWSTPTFPTTSASAGKIIISDGTNWIASTPTYPNSATTTGSFIYANGTNYVASTSLWTNTVGANGVLVQSNGTSNGYTTATYPTTVTSGNLIYASATNVVSGLANTNSAALTSSATGAPQWTALTDGQLVIGSSTGAPIAATLTASTGISIANGHNSVTISVNGANPWVDETGASVTMAANTGYTSDDGASLVTFTLPTTSAIGDWVEINGKGSGGWTIAQAAGQQIHFGSQSTTLGAGGSLSSTIQFNNVKLRCLTANTIWTVVSVQGALTVV